MPAREQTISEAIPDISVIIPTFRRELPLAEALESALGQSGVDLEIFVVDDSPEGSARDVVAGLKDDRVNYRKHPVPTGGYPSIVRNFALPEARAPLIHFLDDDDLVPAGHYARVKSVFAKRPDVGLVFGAIEPFGNGPAEQLADEKSYFEKSRRLAARCRSLGTVYPFVGSMLFVHALLVCSAGVVRRECALARGGFDGTIKVREDVDFYVSIMRRFGVEFVDETTLHYRISSDASLMHTAALAPAELASRDKFLREARETTNAKYIDQWGYGEFLALKLVSRSVRSLL